LNNISGIYGRTHVIAMSRAVVRNDELRITRY